MKNKLYASVLAAFVTVDESVPFYQDFETKLWENNFTAKKHSGLIFLVDDETFEVLGIIPSPNITSTLAVAHDILNGVTSRSNQLSDMLDKLKIFYAEGGRVNIWTQTSDDLSTLVRATENLALEFDIRWNSPSE